MKLACTSGTCSRSFETGELTQLEFLDLCASDFACDSVVLDVRHFPRTDSDYLAQLKKMATDLGLGIAALVDDAFLPGETSAMETRIGQALALGAPLLVTRVAVETAMPWSRQLERLNHATGLAKAANVTIAMRNAPGTFAGTALECKRVSKETDSAWLRYALDPATLVDEDADALQAKSVAMIGMLNESDEAIDGFIERFHRFRGTVVLDSTASCTVADIANATRRWRIASARFELNRT